MAVHTLDAVHGTFGRELICRAPACCDAELSSSLAVAGERDDRGRQRVDVVRRHDEPGLAVGDDLGQAADPGHDRCAPAFGGLERDHAESFAARRDNHERVALQHRGHRRHV
ncbi:MAG TPA: hypothetical protein VGL84_09085, partial [Gaiellaceae bacterium]